MDNLPKGTSKTIISRPAGHLRIGHIVHFYPDLFTVDVSIGSPGASSLGQESIKNVQFPAAHIGASGAFIGGYPDPGTPVIVAQGEGNQWFIVSFLPRDPAAKNRRGVRMPTVEEGTLLLQTDDNNTIKLDSKNGISIGEFGNSLIFDTNRDIISNTFDNVYSFTEVSREINGVILRDKTPNKNFQPSLKATSLDYNDNLDPIGMDPIAHPNWSNEGSSIRNPSRVEKREVVYEYAKSFSALSNDKEFTSYQRNKNITAKDVLSPAVAPITVDRRDGRADTLSLSLVAPNFLMETIKGTVVDSYGNILDINRSIIPLGKDDKLSIKNVKTSLDEHDKFGSVYKNIKTLERRSIAYHFEMNARKDTIAPPDVNDRSNYARNRSRFFLDIDKEGQFKLNVPASSETGNIPLLTRYENFSTVQPNDKSKDPNDLVLNEDKQDIMIESMHPNTNDEDSNGVISISDELNSNAAPTDRFFKEEKTYIKHGTLYHNISNTCISFQDASYIAESIPTTSLGLGRIPPKKDIVNKNITISGPNANGGGRSGSLNFDGSLEVNIGANTIDRHSILLDTQGGIIGNIGRDITNNISTALSFDGEVLLQSGGATPSLDTRFNKAGFGRTGPVNNAVKAGAFDIRVLNQTGQKVAVIRIDNEGITMTTQSRMVFYSESSMQFRAVGKIEIEGEEVNIQNRQVRNESGIGSM